MKTDWVGGVRAYFAETASYARSLPHTLDFMQMTASEGNCRFYDSGILANCSTPDYCFQCVDINFECTSGETRWCDQDQQCQSQIDTPDGICRDLPPHVNLGTITLTGFKEPLTLAPDQYDRYYSTGGPTNMNDLFDDGDILTATTEGGVLPALSFQAKGVAPLEISNQVVELVNGSPATVEWTPADPDSRVQVALMLGSHDPNPLTVAIVCDAPDSDGRVEIPSSVIEGFLIKQCFDELMMMGFMKCSRITRYSRDVKTLNGKEIELFVGSARNLQISVIQ
jgi:hypothetical protein